MKTLPFAIVAGALVAAGCTASPGPAQPARTTTPAVSPQGYAAADYQIRTGNQVAGEARIQPKGVYDATVNGNPRAVVELDYLLANRANTPLELDQIELESVDTGRAVLMNLPPARLDAPTTVDPGGIARVTAYYVMPAGIEAEDISAFRTAWRLSSAGFSYAEDAPFVRTDGEYYYTPGYDPFEATTPQFERPVVSVEPGAYRHYQAF